MSDVINLEDLKKVMDSCYEKAINGIPKVSLAVDDLAIEYLDKYKTKDKAVRKMINTQIIKCTTSGFVTGLGGAITLPVAIPANIGSVLYVQLRMIACTAYVAGYNVNDDEVQTLIYACLVGVSVNQLLKQAGVKVGQKVAYKAIEKIPREVFTKINQKIGFRFITKFGETGVVNLGKLLPGVGGVINGGLDFAETKILGNRAYKWFFMGDFSGNDDDDEQFEKNIIDVECVDV
jgi:hypothetical protein